MLQDGDGTMRRGLLSLVLTASIILSLLVVAQPTGAVLTTVSGPQTVDKPGTIEVRTAVEIREDERIPIDGLVLEIATEDGDAVRVTFAPNGTVLAVDPPRGVVGEGEIRVNRLRKTLTVTPLGSAADYGYGDRSGTDERTDESRAFGYGYGYGYAGDESGLAYEIEMDSRAFKQGEYAVRLLVDTGDGEPAFASNEESIEVRLPTGVQPGERPADRGASGNDVANPDGDDGDADQAARGNGDRGRADERGNDRGRSDRAVAVHR